MFVVWKCYIVGIDKVLHFLPRDARSASAVLLS